MLNVTINYPYLDRPEFEPSDLFDDWEQRKSDKRWARETTIPVVAKFDTFEGSSYVERNTGNILYW